MMIYKLKTIIQNLKFWFFACSFTLCVLNFALISFAQEAKEQEDLSVAEKAYADGFYEISLGLLERFMKDYPESALLPKVNLLLGECLFQKEKYSKARNIFEGLLGSPEAEAVKDAALYWIAQVYFKGKDFVQARNNYQKLVQNFPESSYAALAQYSLGWSFFEEEKFEEAKSAFLTFRNRFAQHSLREDADFKIALCFYNLKDYLKAGENFNLYIEEYPASKVLDEAMFYRAECSYYSGKFEEAEEDYLKVVSKREESKLAELAQVGLGWVYIKLEKYPEAEKVFNKIAALDNRPESSILLGRAEIAKAKEDYASSLELYNRFIDNFVNDEYIYSAYLGKAESLAALFKYEDAIAAYGYILSGRPNKTFLPVFIDKIRYNIAQLYLKIGNFPQAVMEFKKLIDETGDSELRISVICQLADTYYDLGEFQEAIGGYAKILKSYPDNSYNDYVHYRLYLSLIKTAKFDEAISGLKNMAAGFPETKLKPEISYYIGLAYFQKQDFENCAGELDNFTSLFTESYLRQDALYLRAVSLSRLGRYSQAQDVFKEAKKEYSKDENFVAKCEFEIARLIYQDSQTEPAVKKMQEIISRYPNSDVAPEVIFFLGEHYSRVQKEELAIRYFNRIISDYPEANLISGSYYSLGLLYSGLDRYDDALSCFENVLKAEGDEFKAQAVLALGDLYAKKGDFDRAFKKYQEVIKNYMDYSKEAYLKTADIYKQLNKYDESIEAYRQALNKTTVSESAPVQFKIAEVFEESGRIDQAMEEYRKNIDTYHENTYWLVRSYLRLARIFEDRENWREAESIYARLSAMKIEEAKFAQERLDWIRKNAKR